MTLATTFNNLGQTIIPNITAVAFPDLCTITAESTSIVGGEQVKSGTTNAYTSVPCSVKPSSGKRIAIGDQITAVGDHVIKMATHKSGTRINLDAKVHKIVVATRGNEPTATYRIEIPENDNGVVYTIYCTKEH